MCKEKPRPITIQEYALRKITPKRLFGFIDEKIDLSSVGRNNSFVKDYGMAVVDCLCLLRDKGEFVLNKDNLVSAFEGTKGLDLVISRDDDRIKAVILGMVYNHYLKDSKVKDTGDLDDADFILYLLGKRKYIESISHIYKNAISKTEI